MGLRRKSKNVLSGTETLALITEADLGPAIVAQRHGGCGMRDDAGRLSGNLQGLNYWSFSNTSTLPRLTVSTFDRNRGTLNQHSGNNNDCQHETDDNNRTDDVQFCLVFMIARRNSVQQMIERASFDIPSCHGNGF
jgi:hypothetical protein